MSHPCKKGGLGNVEVKKFKIVEINFYYSLVEKREGATETDYLQSRNLRTQ